MTKRKAHSQAKLYLANADTFGIVPELAFLMATQPMWDTISDGVKSLNRGHLIGRPDFPIEQVIDNLRALQELLDLRYGNA